MSYRTLLKLAAGGTATVYVGEAPNASREILAIKKPHPHLFDDPRFITALRREAAIASRLDHPNVVRVRELVTEGDTALLVMDYVDGVSLSDLIRAWDSDRTNDSLGPAIRIALDVCAGLGAAHALKGPGGESLGVIHRDVSPQNVLIDSSGVAKLADFGLTRSIAFGDRSTTDGVLKGKAGYLAPEYVRGAPIDQRIDIFALGVVIWESITKRRLFRGENEADTLQRILKTEIPSVASEHISPDLAKDLDALLARALARSPADRFPNVAELAAELRSLAERHRLVIDHGAVKTSFGPTVRAAIEKQKTAIALARSSGGSKSTKPSRSRNVTVALVSAVVVVLGLFCLHAFSKKDPIAPSPLEVSATPDPTSPPASSEFEIIDSIPIASSSANVSAASSAQHSNHRVVRSKTPDSPSTSTTTSADPPQPRPNPY
jgi:serine/threonine-protein kinase